MKRNYVNAGALFFFNREVPSYFVNDALASNLLYQLGASAEQDGFVDAAAWRNEYLRLMLDFEQVIPRRDVQSLPLHGSDSLWAVVKDKLGPWVSPTQITQAEHVFTHLQSGDSAALKLLQQYTTQKLNDQADAPGLAHSVPAVTPETTDALHTVVLQLVFVDKEPILTQVFLSFTSTSPLTSLPLLPFIQQETVVGNLELSIYGVELDEDSYSDIRQTVLEQLGVYRNELIIGLDEVEP